MKPLEWLLGWWGEKLERSRQRRAAARCGDARACGEALAWLAKHPAAQEVAVDSPVGKALFTRADVPRLEAVTKSVGEKVLARSMMMGISGYGFPGLWSQNRAEQVQHYKTWVYIAVRAIWNRIGRLTPNIGFVVDDAAFGQRVKSFACGAARPTTGDLAETRFREWRFKKSMGAVRPHENVIPAPTTHPLVRLLNNPNRPDVAFDLWSELGIFWELTGNAYLWGPASRLGILDGTYKPEELWVIPSHWIPSAKIGKDRFIESYDLRPYYGGRTYHLPACEVTHIRYKSPIHKIDGYAPTTAGAEWIDTGESVNRARFWQFKNGSVPTGALELGEGYVDPSDEDLERIYAKFMARYQGEQNTGKPVITPPGAKYVPLTIAPNEMAYVQSADQLRDWILALWGVPKEVAGIQDAGSEIAMYGPLRQFSENVLMPRLVYLGQVLTEKLAHRWDKRLRVWWDDPTPDDPQQKRRDMLMRHRTESITANEIRAAYGDPPLPESDVIDHSPGAGSGAFGGGLGGGGFPPGKAQPRRKAKRPAKLARLLGQLRKATANGHGGNGHV